MTNAGNKRDEASFGPCRAEFTGDELVIGNDVIQRCWHVRDGRLVASSLKDLRSGFEWLAIPSNRPAPVEASPREGASSLLFAAEPARPAAVSQEGLSVMLAAEDGSLTYRFMIFPGSAGVTMQLLAQGAADGAQASSAAKDEASGIETIQAAQRDRLPEADVLERLELSPKHLQLTQVELVDQTDINNELVHEKSWLLHPSQSLELQGNLFFLEEPVGGNGLIFIKLAPLPAVRPVACQADLIVDASSNHFRSGGQPYDAQHPGFPLRYRVAMAGHCGDETGEGYPFAVLAYTGGRLGRIAELQKYQRQFRPYVAGRDGTFLSNTWGDRSQDKCICEAFMLEEVAAAAKLGVDVVQIDDGWECGRTANSAAVVSQKKVWEGFWAADPNFWKVDTTRFPHGLESVIAAAAAKGMKMGLWFGPDSANDFANWRKDADLLLDIHRRLGIDYFKIDGVKARTKLSEANLRRFFQAVSEQSGGKIVLDLDVTAEVRPGYFGAMEVGPLFVENRYTDWHRYWPHQTLRNLWKLAHHVDPCRLRMEFLNYSRNQNLYVDDPLAPSEYDPAYLFATVMFASPLGWFEISRLPAQYFKQVPPLVRRWKAIRDRLFTGTIYPIGQEPDGASWTGFISVCQGANDAYILLFREVNQQAAWTCDLPELPTGRYSCTRLAGSGSLHISGGKLSARIPQPRQFLLAHVKTA